jgi:predicted HAD superfamily Cof-like phosphohydrolase
MKKQLEQVKEFNKSFNVPVSPIPNSITIDRISLRHKLLKEEVEEYFEGAWTDDLENILKELADIQYVLLGTVLEHGMQDVFEEAFNRVHANNMLKLEKGTLRSDGKIQKPENFPSVDLKDLFI